MRARRFKIALLALAAMFTSGLACAQSDTHPYTVRLGDTLGLIAKTHGVTVDEIVKANRIHVDDKLRVGRILKLPIGRYPGGEQIPPPLDSSQPWYSQPGQ